MDKPIEEKDTHSGEGNGLIWGLSAMQGWRVEMEVRREPGRGLGLGVAGVREWRGEEGGKKRGETCTEGEEEEEEGGHGLEEENCEEN